MKAVRSIYIIFTRRPWLAIAGCLVIAFLLVSCGASAPGTTPASTPDLVPTQQATAVQTPEIASGESATGAGGVTPIAVPTRTPDPNRQVGGKVGDLAAEVEGIIAWINSEPLTIEELRGKVVLVDFWTYTCINCIRTFPFLKLWHSRYADDGLVILGVHAPEFEFEKNLDNVVTATRDNGIQWPVALDNDFVTWKNYSNNVWPAKYLIDQEGIVRYTHLGEGAYAETETTIRELLKEAGANLPFYSLPFDQNLDVVYEYHRILGRNAGQLLPDSSSEVTRELYAGYHRALGEYAGQVEYYQNQDTLVNFRIPEELSPHLIYLNGPWFVGPESVKHGQDTADYEDYLTIVYSARSVNAVLTSDSGEDYRVRVTMNGENLTPDNKGADVTIGPDGESYVLVTEPRMYNIVENPDYLQRQTLRMSSNSADFGLFAFTFGVYEKAS